MSLQIYEASDYDKKEFERILSECNVSEDDMKFHAVMVRLYGTDPRINPVSQGTTAMSDSGTIFEEFRKTRR